ncbi:Cobalamin synthesis protein cobW C-terminal domain-containing protein [Paraburkholderia steynii]|uniref:Cobalamin synthesis protein cobW C-terminal domain-containing protein n=1 Tax=Paraburkholderia steynii TaxID=1245441 RepID=A0A7Z7BGK7_9BURK|nr:GTP-binding protein [Paraburkholderia steynii]SDJ15642.1 Cobalamin synthesis protein cobW C-terminal domain-containing protein [Paraburkholderia steynii]
MQADVRPSQSESYGIASWVYRERAPFHPARLLAWLQQPWSKRRLLRCKGYFWAAHRHVDIGMLVQTGGRFQWGYVGRWWCFVPQPDWPRDDYRRQGVLDKWEEPVGDCRQEIVFIGQAVDHDRLRQDRCVSADRSRNRSGPKRMVASAGCRCVRCGGGRRISVTATTSGVSFPRSLTFLTTGHQFCSA